MEKFDGQKHVTQLNNGMFFTDGYRKIDFVLVYLKDKDTKIHQLKRESFLESLIKEGLDIEIQDNSDYLHDHINNVISHEGNLVFIKINASWKTLCRYSEIMKIRKPIKDIKSLRNESPKSINQKIFHMFNCINLFNIKERNLQPMLPEFTWPFSKSKTYIFDIPPDKAEFFTSSERSLIVNYILRRASYRASASENMTHETCLSNCEDNSLKISDIILDKTEQPENLRDTKFVSSFVNQISLSLNEEYFHNGLDLGIDRLISDGVFDSAYSLHENLLSEGKEDQNLKMNQRNLLYKHWARMKNIFRMQPLHHIRLYFGEKVAFYFAWLGFYTNWLFPVSLFGVIITIYNIVYTSDDIILNEIYQGKNITMCPLFCSLQHCHFWKLKDGYNQFFITHILDNGGTVLLAIVVSIWASLFLEMWKRHQNKLAFKWNVYDIAYEKEPSRPEFVVMIDKHYPAKFQHMTDNEDLYLPFWRRKLPCTLFSYSTVLLLIIMAIALLVGIILYRLIALPLLLNSHKMGFSAASIIITITGSIIYVITIMILASIYYRVAAWLTDLECHRTQSQYDNSLTLKLCLLEFINNYSFLFYIAFIQKYTKSMNNQKSWIGNIIHTEGCSVSNCLFDLFMQLAFIMIGRQLINMIMEYSTPRINSLIQKHKLKKSESKIRHRKECYDGETLKTFSFQNEIHDTLDDVNIKSELKRCYTDYLLTDPGPRPLFNEYIEMLIQFGFITIFIPAFPLAPLFALINNLLEIRSDAVKFIYVLRRPIAQRVKDIGIWLNLLAIIVQVAIKSNAMLIAFTTTYIDRLVYVLFYSPDLSLKGFMKFSISYMNASQFNSKSNFNDTVYCGFLGYQYPPWEKINEPYSYTPIFWHILAFKLIFLYLFENFVSVVVSITFTIIPDIPNKLIYGVREETKLINNIILKAEMAKNKIKQTSSKKIDLESSICCSNRLEENSDDLMANKSTQTHGKNYMTT